MGLPPPSSHLYTGTFCCTCRVTSLTCDPWYAYTCKTQGRSFEHDGFMDKIVDQLHHSRLRITAREPRCKHYNGASGKGGPDATFVHPNGAITHVDASGIILASTHTHILTNSGLPAKLPLKPRQTFSWQAFSPRSKPQAGHLTTLGCPPLISVIGPRTPATTP